MNQVPLISNSEEQTKIIESNNDYILVLACPGSGKTHTLISKYINIIQKGDILSDEIILITFTKKAGQEMYNRLNNLVPDKLPFYVGSLHGLAYKILSEYYKINFTVIDDKDANEILKELSNNLDKSINVNQIIDQISTIYPLDIKSYLTKHKMTDLYKPINKIYNDYRKYKLKQKLYDFNDLMINFCNFLDNNDSYKFINKIKYVFFDEYQDINQIQNYILNKLSKHCKLMIVGDDAQSIYSFRGSCSNYILDINNSIQLIDKKFESYYLNNNYRSSSSIINFCQNIINNNNRQIKKNIVSVNNYLEKKPTIICFNSKLDQYKWIINDIKKKKLKYSNIAILAKNNYSLDNIEIHLLSNNISISKHIGSLLLNKNHIKDFLAWICVIINPNSLIHWKRIFNLYGINININNKYNIIKILKNHDPSDLITNNNFEIYDIIYNHYLKLKNLNNDDDKIKYIILIFENKWKDNTYTKDINNLLKYFNDSTLENFINNLYINFDTLQSSMETIYLSTIHGSKGLEWDVVYIIDMDNKIIRNSNKYYLDELENINEDRRVFYVGASRAKFELYITVAVENNNNISPLIKELDGNNYDIINYKNNYNIKLTFDITTDINNYIKHNGFLLIDKYLSKLNIEKKNIHPSLNYIIKFDDNDLKNLSEKKTFTIYTKTINNFLILTIYNILSNNYNLSTNNIHLINDTWYKSLDKLLLFSYNKNNNKNILSLNESSEDIINFYNNIKLHEYKKIESSLCNLIANFNTNKIMLNHTYKCNHFDCHTNILCINKEYETMAINIYFTKYEIASINNIIKFLINTYLLKNDYNIKTLILYNPYYGEIYQILLDNINLYKIKKIFYNN